ncbi:MAG: rhodanese-like domain-containing protein [Desulfosarcinaceae bacterium]|nr:rhodanese-like domain-containing protein [Desulfosarcinaceae bacterium]
MTRTRIFTLITLAALVMALFAGCAGSKQAAAPTVAKAEEEWRFHDIVDVEFVKAHVTVPMANDVVLIDSRPKRAKYDKGHIPGAISIPDTYFDKQKDQLPEDKNALLIFYCGGLHCKLSHKSAAKAEALGYTNVKVFAEGFPKWMKMPGNYAAVDVDWVKKQVTGQKELALVDSRPKRAKYDKGHIPGAISIPDTYFDKQKDQLPADKSKPLVFYCGGLHCKLSHKSAAKAMAMGYTNVKVFAAGYPAWKKAGGTAGMQATAAPAQLKAGSEEGSIDIVQFKEIVTSKPESVMLIDVRDPDEFKKGSFKTAVNIPVDTLEGKIKSLPANKPIVFVCGTGARSGESYYMVQDLRPELKNVYYLEAELIFNSDGSYTLKEPV